MATLFVGPAMLQFGCNTEKINIPNISTFNPATSKIDAEITITGTNFSKVLGANNVTIGGFRCPILEASPTQLRVKGIPGIISGQIAVTVDHLTGISTGTFTLTPHLIDTVFQHEGFRDDTVDIRGLYFCELVKDVKVKFQTAHDSLTTARIINYLTIGDTARFSAIVPDSAVTGRINITVGKITAVDKYNYKVNK